MTISEVKRPWIQQAQRKDKSSKYQSKSWHNTRDGFKLSDPINPPPPILHVPYRNIYCYNCWLEGKINDERIEVDHTIPVKQGGTDDYTNLRSLCHAHHNKKTGNDIQLYRNK